MAYARKKIVLVACGTGIATSTVVCKAIDELLEERRLQAELIQCKMMEVPAYLDRADLLVTTTVADKGRYPFPVINGRPFLTGIGREQAEREILEQLAR